MSWEISKSTTLCISLSARPSNIGTRFHNFLYRALDLDFVYKAFSPVDIEQAVQGIRGLGIRGAAVSMPFKETVIPLIDSLDETALKISSVNTIVNTDGILRGYNTDFAAVRSLLQTNNTQVSDSILVVGSGGMAKAVVAAVADLGLKKCKVFSRNADAGQALAFKYGFERVGIETPADVIINATPVGMAGSDEAQKMPVSADIVGSARVVFDVVAVPEKTPLIACAEDFGKKTILGTEVMTLQAVEQFVLYTGITPSDELVEQASKYSRQS